MTPNDRLASLARSLRRDTRGAAGVLIGSSMMALIGAGALAVDLGSLYLAERRLQGIADAAAMAAVSGDIQQDGRDLAMEIIDRRGLTGISIASLTPGRYLQDKSVAPADRFASAASDPTAVEIELEHEVPLFFGRILSGEASSKVRARATAAREDVTAFSLGTRLASLSGGLPNKVLSELAGTELSLSVMDSQAIANTQIDVLGFADAVKAGMNNDMKSYGEVFDAEIPLHKAVEALARSSSDSTVTGLISAISRQLGSQGIRIADIIELGPMGKTDVYDGSSGTMVDAYSLLRAMLEASHGDHYQIEFDTTVAGLAGATVKIVGGSGEVRSPWLTITSKNDATIRTAQSRIYVDAKVGPAALGTALLRVPLYVELAEAEAGLDDIQCGTNGSEKGVTLAVTPSVGTVAIASVDPGQMNDLTNPVTVRPARLAGNSIAGIDGFANIELGGASPQSVFFSEAAIAAHRTKTVSTGDLVQATAASLVRNTQVTVTLLGLNLGLGLNKNALIASTTSSLLSAAPALDGLLNQVTQTLGVKLGSADVRIDRLRCGVPALMA